MFPAHSCDADVIAGNKNSSSSVIEDTARVDSTCTEQAPCKSEAGQDGGMQVLLPMLMFASVIQRGRFGTHTKAMARACSKSLAPGQKVVQHSSEFLLRSSGAMSGVCIFAMLFLWLSGKARTAASELAAEPKSTRSGIAVWPW